MRFPCSLRLLLAFSLIFVLDARAQTSAPVENSRRANRSWVSDNANVLSEAEERRISAVSAELEKRTGAELEIVTLRTLGGQDIKRYANDLFRELGIGKKGRDNGIIILGVFDPDAVAGQRKSHIEVGYGLEGELPDGKAVAILRDQTLSQWKNGNYGEGFYQGAVAVAKIIDPTFTPPAASSGASPPTSQPQGERDFERRGEPSNGEPFDLDFPVTTFPAGSGILLALMGLLVFFFPLLMIGGAIWLFVATRRRPLRCSKCRAPMQQLSDAAELPSLSPVQQFEQQIGARDYRVWHCHKCRHQDITAHDLPFSEFVQCPTCRHQTASTLVETLRSATPRKGGLERVILSCQWPDCKHSSYYTRPTPPDQRIGYGQGNHRGYGSGNDLLTGIVLGSILGNSHQSGGGWSSGGDSGGSSGDFGGGSSGDFGGGFDSGPSDFGGGDSGGGGGSADW